MPPMDREDLNNMLRELRGVLTGNYYYIYPTESLHWHWGIFSKKSLKENLIYAFYFTTVLTVIETANWVRPSSVQYRFYSQGGTTPSSSHSEGHRYVLMQEDKKIPFSEAFKLMQGQDMKEETEQVGETTADIGVYAIFSSWLVGRVLWVLSVYFAFLGCFYCFRICIAAFSILWNVFLRHVIARNRNDLMLGALKIRRIRTML